jgi:hypothetical protein
MKIFWLVPYHRDPLLPEARKKLGDIYHVNLQLPTIERWSLSKTARSCFYHDVKKIFNLNPHVRCLKVVFGEGDELVENLPRWQCFLYDDQEKNSETLKERTDRMLLLIARHGERVKGVNDAQAR